MRNASGKGWSAAWAAYPVRGAGPWSQRSFHFLAIASRNLSGGFRGRDKGWPGQARRGGLVGRGGIRGAHSSAHTAKLGIFLGFFLRPLRFRRHQRGSHNISSTDAYRDPMWRLIIRIRWKASACPPSSLTGQPPLNCPLYIAF